MNLAMVYSGDIRDNGSPFYLRLAAAQVMGHELDWYTEDPSADKGGITSGFDFYFHPDDGRDDLSVAEIPHPWGYWIMDSHLGAEVRIEKAKQADLVWCTQLPFVAELAKHGIGAKWVPAACEPLIHIPAPPDVIPDQELVFVGHLGDRGRLDFLHELFDAIPGWYSFGLFHEDMAREYHRAVIGVNHAVRNDLNMRFFELAAMGVPQLADTRMAGLQELGFLPWKHYIPYSNVQEAISRAREAMQDFPALACMTELAREKILKEHTYVHRFRAMLGDVKEFLNPCRDSSLP